MIMNALYNVVAQRVDQNGYVVNEKILNSGEVFQMISFITSLNQDDIPNELWPKDGEFTDIMIFDHQQTVRIKRTLVGGEAAP